MSHIVGRLERSRNPAHRRRFDSGNNGTPVDYAFVPRYAKYLIPAMLIGIGIFGAALVGVIVLP